jgi:hypothetical protein
MHDEAEAAYTTAIELWTAAAEGSSGSSTTTTICIHPMVANMHYNLALLNKAKDPKAKEGAKQSKWEKRTLAQFDFHMEKALEIYSLTKGPAHKEVVLLRQWIEGGCLTSDRWGRPIKVTLHV